MILNTIRIILEEFIIWNGLTLCRIGIEIVIHMNTIYIIAAHDIFYNFTDIVAIFRYSRVQDKLIVICKTTHRLANGNMILCQFLRTFCFGTIWINPCMEFHMTLMTLIDHPLQWIPVRTWCYTLLPSKESAPRFDLTLIESITLRTYLEDNHIYTIFLQLIELICQCLLHFLGSHTLELSVYALNPRTTHFPFHLSTCCHSEQQRHYK